MTMGRHIGKDERPLSDAEQRAAMRNQGQRATGGDMICSMPVPSDAGPPPDFQERGRSADHKYPYFAADGSSVLGYVYRWDAHGDADKIIRPVTFCRPRNGNGKGAWRMSGWPAPRPLYGLDQLAAKPSAVVLLMEGEPKADVVNSVIAWSEAFTVSFAKREIVGVSWSGGAQSVAKADFTPLAGREVVIVRDNDAPGKKAGDALPELLHQAGVRIVRRWNPSPKIPEGWDIADDLPSGVNGDELVAEMLAAPEVTPVAQPGDGYVERSDEYMAALLADERINAQSTEERIADEPSAEPSAKVRRLVPVDMSRWDDEPVPKQEWTVLNRIPRRQCVLFSGEGGGGKSSIGLHECVSHVIEARRASLGLPAACEWLGALPEPGPAMFIDAEDDERVMHRRLAHIIDYYGIKFADLIRSGLHLFSWFGQEDTVLATVSRSGKMEPTPLYRGLLEAAGDIKPVSICIASCANVFVGNESDRPQVQQFVNLMTRVALAANGSLALIAHPSQTGITTGSGISGSTQWHNAVRARFYL
jgi:hypothetical protein